MNNLKCDICNVQITSDIAMVQHISGRRHQNNDKFLKESKHVDERSIFVHNIQKSAIKNIDLKDIFGKYGKINHIHKINENCSILEFDEISNAKKALSFAEEIYKYYQLQIKKRIKKVDKISKARPKMDKSKKINYSLIKSNDISQENRKYNIIEELKNITTFDDQVDELINLISLKDKDLNDRQMLHDDILNFLKSIDPLSKVYQFGSLVSGFGVQDSDVDIFIEIPQISLLNISKKLKRCQKFYNSCYIKSKKCPVINTCHFSTNIFCDISMNNKLGLNNSFMLKRLCDRILWLKPLVLILRYWSKLSEVSGHNKTDTSRMTNYALCMLIIFYLQHIKVIPSFKYMADIAENKLEIDHWDASFPCNLDFIQVSNDLKLENLFYGFFKFYSNFCFEKKMISLRMGTAIDKASKFENKSNIKVTCMMVQDPFDLSQNVCKTISPILYKKIKENFDLATGLCESMMKEQGSINLALFYDFWNQKFGLIETLPNIKNKLRKKIEDQNILNPYTFSIPLDISMLKAEYLESFTSISELKMSWAEDVTHLILQILSSIYKFDIKTISNLPNFFNTNINYVNESSDNIPELYIFSKIKNSNNLNNKIFKNELQNVNLFDYENNINSYLKLADMEVINKDTSITNEDVCSEEYNIQCIQQNTTILRDSIDCSDEYKYNDHEYTKQNAVRKNSEEDEPINKKHKLLDTCLNKELFTNEKQEFKLNEYNSISKIELKNNIILNNSSSENDKSEVEGRVNNNDFKFHLNNKEDFCDLVEASSIVPNNMEFSNRIEDSYKNTPLQQNKINIINIFDKNSLIQHNTQKSNKVDIILAECITKNRLWIDRNRHLHALKNTTSNNFLLQIKITEKILSEMKSSNVVNKKCLDKLSSQVNLNDKISHSSNIIETSNKESEFSYDKNEEKFSYNLSDKTEKQNENNKLNSGIKDKLIKTNKDIIPLNSKIIKTNAIKSDVKFKNNKATRTDPFKVDSNHDKILNSSGKNGKKNSLVIENSNANVSKMYINNNDNENNDARNINSFNKNIRENIKLNCIKNIEVKQSDTQNSMNQSLNNLSPITNISSTYPIAAINNIGLTKRKNNIKSRRNLTNNEKNIDNVKNLTSTLNSGSNVVNIENSEESTCENKNCEIKFQLKVEAVDEDIFSLAVTIVPEFFIVSDNAKFFTSFKNVTYKIVHSILNL